MYEANIGAIEKVWPDFGEKIGSRYTPSDETEAITAESGDPGLKYRGRYLTSRRAPRSEASRVIEARFPVPPDIAVFLHFGLGYELEALWERHPGTQVILLEPDVPLFLAGLAVRDVRHLVSRRELTMMFDAPPGILGEVLNDRHHEVIEFFPLTTIARLHPEYLEAVTEWFRRFQSRREINRNTLRRFGRLWVGNLLQNLQAMNAALPVGDLQGILDGRPSLVLAAGPSLDLLIPAIEQLQQRMAIIAVDTAAAWCAHHGIRPDFLIVVDPQYWNTRHLDKVSQPQVLISESSTHPAVFRNIRGPKYFCASLFPLGRFLERHLGIHGNLGAGGSVATTAWDFARFLGAGQIFCAGLDLGFPDMRTHYHGSLFEELSHVWSDRTQPAMGQQFRVVRDGNPYRAEASDGGLVVSDKRLSLYRWWFENRMQEASSPPTYNLSPRGVRIEGMQPIRAEELLELPEIRTELAEILPSLGQSAAEGSGNPPQERVENLTRGLSELDTILAELESTARKAIEILHAPRTDIPAVVDRLQELDAEILASRGKDIAGFLIETEPDETSDPLGTSEKLYTSILDSVLYHRDLIRRSAERLQD